MIENVKNTLIQKRYEAIPIIDNKKQIVEILFWNALFQNEKKKYTKINAPVVIMAGGRGTRLDPFTRILPKPLIPIGDKTMLEVIMDEYKQYGITDFYISVNHKAKLIKAYFEETKINASIKFIDEDKPLGTAGALKFIEGKIDVPFFVSNCDIIIKNDYADIYDFHIKEKYDITIVASMQHYKIPYGICEILNGGSLDRIVEKPEYDFLVNTGMYILNPNVLSNIPSNEFFHITHLIEKIKSKRLKVGVYPVSEKAWIDVGQWSEFNKVNSLKR